MKSNHGLAGIPKTVEHRAKLSAALKGRKLSEETRHKMSEARKGRKQSAETRAKISATRLRRKIPGHWRERNPKWKGGVRYANGYRHLLRPEHPRAASNGYVAEHILIACEKYGRIIDRREVVHHINGDRLDNRPDNLIVLTRVAHLLEHDVPSIGGRALQAKRKHGKFS